MDQDRGPYDSDARDWGWSQRCSRRAASRSGGSEPAAAAATFAARCSGRRVPGMTVVTSGFERMKRRASWASVSPSGTNGRTASTRGIVAARFAGPKYVLRQSPSGQWLPSVRVPRQASLVQRHAGDDRHAQLPAGGKELVLGRLVEDVVDDLDGVDQACSQGPEDIGRLPPIDADPDVARQALSAQVVRDTLPARVVPPVVLPDVELH